MASFPTSIWAPTTKNNNDVIQPSHVNDAQSEIVAIETAALTAGSWTPAIKFGGNSVGVTYSGQTGVYIQVGKFGHAQFDFTLTSKGSSTGAATITGLPFSANGNGACGVIDFANNTGVNLRDSVYCNVIGSTIALLQTSSGSAGRTTLSDANFSGTDNLRGSITIVTS